MAKFMQTLTVSVEWLIENYLVKVNTDESGWITIYSDPNDGRYWVRTFIQGEMQGGGPPLLYCIGVTYDSLYRGMTVNERLYVAGLITCFDRAIKQKNIQAITSILNSVEIDNESIEEILKSHGIKSK